MRNGWVRAALVATGAIVASTLGTGFVVGFALIFVGALVLAVALEPMVGAALSTGPVAPEVPEVRRRGPAVA